MMAADCLASSAKNFMKDDLFSPEQMTLLDVPPAWRSLWRDMPEFNQEDKRSWASVTVCFRSVADRREFLRMLGEDSEKQKSVWYPRMRYLRQTEPLPKSVSVKPNKYPIYIVSKGRFRWPYTIRSLERLGIPFSVVIEPQELVDYREVVDPGRLLILPFSNLGQGSIPARNWIWEHSLGVGAERHWVLDDNIDGFYTLNDNLKKRIRTENPFLVVEEFIDRYENVGLAGMHYEFFMPRREVRPPFYLNTRVYSCTLVRNDLPFRWRGIYNEDTDLSLRVLKSGLATVLFNYVLAKKMPTMKLKGGNTDALYQGDGRLRMAQSLKEQHPDVVKITRKWNRWQHHVDYAPFKRNKLIPKAKKLFP